MGRLLAMIAALAMSLTWSAGASAQEVKLRLASFLPALKKNIAVQPGMQSFLAINLNSLFSSVELVSLAPGQAAIVSDASTTAPTRRARAAGTVGRNGGGLCRAAARCAPETT